MTEAEKKEVIIEALAKGTTLHVQYGIRTRQVTPWLLGENAAGQVLLHAYQTMAEGQTERGWRYFYVDQMRTCSHSLGAPAPDQLVKNEGGDWEAPPVFAKVLARRLGVSKGGTDA